MELSAFEQRVLREVLKSPEGRPTRAIAQAFVPKCYLFDVEETLEDLVVKGLVVRTSLFTVAPTEKALVNQHKIGDPPLRSIFI